MDTVVKPRYERRFRIRKY
ncbi:MAG: hypothetical protein ACIPMY_01035 [Rickettsia endosymbiont of Pentastiridius leporinus]